MPVVIKTSEQGGVVAIIPRAVIIVAFHDVFFADQVGMGQPVADILDLDRTDLEAHPIHKSRVGRLMARIKVRGIDILPISCGEIDLSRIRARGRRIIRVYGVVSRAAVGGIVASASIGISAYSPCILWAVS